MSLNRPFTLLSALRAPKNGIRVRACLAAVQSSTANNQANLPRRSSTFSLSKPVTRAMSTSNADVPRQIVKPDSASPSAPFGKEHIAKGIGRLSDHVLTKGQGVWVQTEGGATLLDFTCVSLALTALGGCKSHFVIVQCRYRRHEPGPLPSPSQRRSCRTMHHPRSRPNQHRLSQELPRPY
jgi:hypothetical protein